MNTRLSKLDNGDYDAIILAAAGLIRLGFSDRIRAYIEPDESLPAIGQGAIGIECRSNDERIKALIAPLHHSETATRLAAERAMNERLNGGCQVPIAGHATLDGDTLTINGLVGVPDGSRIIRASSTGTASDAVTLGTAVADELLANGADDILKSLYAEQE